MTYPRTDASVERGYIRSLAPAPTARRLFAAGLCAGKDGVAKGVRGSEGRVEEGRGRQQGTRDDADAPSFASLLTASVLCVRDEPPGSSLLCSEGAAKDEVVGRPRRASRTGQERAAGQEGRRGRTVARAPALRFRPACVRRASELVLVEFQGHGNDWEQAAEAEYALDVLQWVSTQAKRRRRK